MKSSPIALTSAKLPDASRLTLAQVEEAWRGARDETARAYREWCTAPIAQRRTTYTVYLAAADRETAAEVAFVGTMRAARRDS